MKVGKGVNSRNLIMVVLVFQKAKSMFMTVCGGIIIKRSEADQIADLF